MIIKSTDFDIFEFCVCGGAVTALEHNIMFAIAII